MRLFFFVLLAPISLVACQIKPIYPTASPTAHIPVPEKAKTSTSKGNFSVAGRVFISERCPLHLDLLSVELAGPEPSSRIICSTAVSSVGRYRANCDAKPGEYTLNLKDARDGRVVTSRRLDSRASRKNGNQNNILNEFDFEPCGLRTVELATPESYPGAKAKEDSSLE